MGGSNLSSHWLIYSPFGRWSLNTTGINGTAFASARSLQTNDENHSSAMARMFYETCSYYPISHLYTLVQKDAKLPSSGHLRVHRHLKCTTDAGICAQAFLPVIILVYITSHTHTFHLRYSRALPRPTYLFYEVIEICANAATKLCP